MDFLRLSIIKIMIDDNYCKNNVDNSKKSDAVTICEQ